VQKALNHKFEDSKVSYTKRDVILYALGAGASELKFVYENDDNFSALPTYPVVLPQKGTSNDVVPFGSNMELPGLNFDPMMILHGEQYVEIKKPIPTHGSFTARPKIIGVYDKGKGALVLMETSLLDDKGETVTRSVGGIFIRGLGGFGGDRGPSENINIPNRAPDAQYSQKTSEFQALIYRLSADYNPLHVDPQMATMVGFKKPILHGLCTFGHAGRAVLSQFCDNDPKRFKAIKARFASPVYPGETLVTEMWRESPTRVVFRTKVQERDVIVINNSYVDIDGGSNSSPAQDLSSEPALKSSIIFTAMSQTIETHPEVAKKVNAIYQFNLTGPTPTTYTVDLKNCKIYQGEPTTKPDCVLTISDEDYFDMATGKIDPQTAFLKGKLKVKGNIMLAQKLSIIQQAASKL
jgi:3-hydroxyacyl-CoA dehydrogenase/3a,7a,12a-trihydroxy-5b-cholest-24-enoyl-CoA hydratase